MSLLGDKLIGLHTSLERGGIPHAFGGAIALAYCTFEPRGTQDLDINIFVPHQDAARALVLLPAEVVVTEANRRQIAIDAQARLWWDETPIDVFFNNVPFHELVAARVRLVDFADTQIPVLDCMALAVFKAFFNRTKDWADLEAMAAAEQLDMTAVSIWIARLLGDDDGRISRIAELEHPR